MKTEFTLPDDIITAIKDNDTKVLEKFVQEQLNHYHATKNILELKNIILVCNQLFLMTGKNYLTPADINRIGSYLLHNTVWSKYNILLFANSPFLLNSKIGYQIALRIIHNFHPTESLNENTTIFIGGLSDTVIALVFKKKLDYAQKILNELKKIELPFYLMFFSLTLTLLQKIIDYCHTLNAQPVLAMIDTIVQLNCMEVAQKWLEIFKDVQQIWPEKEN